jgi:zinc protease
MYKFRQLFSLISVLVLMSPYYLLSAGKYEEGKVYRHKFDNGFTILTMERHLAPLIYHQLTYKVGSRNEHLGITGISHVCEHMMFKGTPTCGKGVASKTISDNSGIFNAFTMNDMTSYYEYLPADKIEVAMKIESDRMQNCSFIPSEFKSELEVIKQERRMRTESSANGILMQELNAVAFDSSPNRDPVIGWPNDLKTVTRDQAYNYYKTYYTPNNSFLVLIGDFDTDKILDLVKKYYGAIPKGPDVPDLVCFEEPQQVRKTLTLYHPDVTSPTVGFSFHIPNIQDTDAAPLRVVEMLFCEKSRDARLYKRMVETDRIATMVAGGFGITKDPGLFKVNIIIKPDSSVDRVEKIFWDEVQKLKYELVSDKELQKAKNRYKYAQIADYIKNADLAGRISMYECFFGWDYYDVSDSRIKNVNKEDIKRVMNKYFNPEQVTVSYLFPKEGNKIKGNHNNDEDQKNENLNNLSPDKFYYMPPQDALELTASMNPASDGILKPQQIAPMVKKMKLDNGIILYTIENHLVPTISVIGALETGTMPEALDDGGKPGMPAVLSSLMNRGPEGVSYNDFVERLAYIPYSFSIDGSYKNFDFQGNSLVENSDEMMKTGFDLVTKPALNNDDLEKLRPQYIISSNDRLKKTSMKAFYYMFNNIMGEHPLTHNNPTEESIKSITRDDLVALHKKYFRPDITTMLMVGDMTPDQMKDLANKYFGKWTKPSEPLTVASSPKVKDMSKKVIRVFSDKDYAQCTINIGFAPYNNIDPNESEIVTALNSILASSALTSRMGIELRDKQGLFYGIKSELWVKGDKIGYWKFNTQTAPKNTEKLIIGIFAEIKKLLKDGVTDDELQIAKNKQLGYLPFAVETPDDAASIIFNLLLDKRPLDSFDKKADRINSITKDDILRVAKKYFTLDNFVIAVDGPIDEHSLDNVINEL